MSIKYHDLNVGVTRGGEGAIPYTSNPEMDGIASPGSSSAYSRGNHVHPSDTTKAGTEMLAKVLHDPAGQNVAVGEYAIFNGQLYKANTAITSSMAASTFASYLTAVTGGGLNAVGKIASKEVEIPLTTIGSSMTQTARLIGQCTTLFGIAATSILSIGIADAGLTPASIMVAGTYNDGFYLAATQSCTLSSSVKFRIIYTI